MKIVEIDYQGYPEALYCPVCGTIIVGNNVDPSCEHIIFAHETASGSFFYVRKDYKNAIDIISSKYAKGDIEDPVEELVENIDIDCSICLCITSFTLPDSLTLSVGIDFNPEAK